MRTPPPVPFLLAALLLVSLAGCQRSAVETTTPGASSSDQTAQALSEIRQYQQETGKSLEALAAELKRRESLEAEKTGDPPVVRDLAVARAALQDAKEAVQAHNGNETSATLRRLRRVLQAIGAELPAALIIQQCDRAIYSIHSQQAVGSQEFVAASLALLAASDTAVNGRPASLVPDVLNGLESAKAAVDKGNGAAALKTINGVITKASSHPTMSVIARASAGVRGAEEAQYRQAWPVVAAELDEVGDLLADLAQAIAPQGTGSAATKGSTATKPAASESETPATPAPAGNTQTAPSTEAPAQQVAPSGGGSGAPAATT